VRIRVVPEDEEEMPPWSSWGWDLEGEAYRALFVRLCEQDGGHDWYLEIDPDDGVTLSCRTCPASVDDVYPDGSGLLTGEFEVFPGYVLGLRLGDVEVNGQWVVGCFAYGWRGPVTVGVQVEKYYCPDYGSYEYDAWVIVEARDDA
jgi:hypothetical protein